MPARDYYQILGVPEDAEAAEIKTAYRRLAVQYHPDRNRDNAQAADDMKRLNEAYAVLSSASRRREYDRLRRQFGPSAQEHFRQSYSEQDIFRGSDIEKVFEEMARRFGFRGFEEVFREFYGQGFQHFQHRRPGFSVRGFVFTSPFGARNTRQRMPGGIPGGRLADYLFRKIGGSRLPVEGADVKDAITLSPELARSGGPYAYFHAARSKQLIVKITPAVRNGQQIRLAGQGKPGRYGGKDGDLLLKVRIRKPLLARLKALLGRK